MLALLLSAADGPVRSDADTIHLQNRMMHNIFTTLESNNICGWYGVHCVDGIVDKIAWNGAVLRKPVTLRWLPHTARDVLLENVEVVDGLQTRLLPRESRYFYIDRPKILDDVVICLDMRALPLNMEEFHVRKLRPVGPVDLRDLPRTMIAISIIVTPVSFVLMDGTRLPDHLRVIRLTRGNKAPCIRNMGEAAIEGKVEWSMYVPWSSHYPALYRLMGRRSPKQGLL